MNLSLLPSAYREVNPGDNVEAVVGPGRAEMYSFGLPFLPQGLLAQDLESSS